MVRDLSSEIQDRQGFLTLLPTLGRFTAISEPHFLTCKKGYL